MKRYTFLIIGVLFSTGLTVAQFTPHVLWDRSGGGPQSMYGMLVFSLGDQNNDGYADWGVFASGTSPGTPSERLAEFFYGGNPPASTPYHTFRVNPDSVWDIWGVEAAGDINGDGYIDWMAWLRYYTIPFTHTVHFYLGGPGNSENPVMTLHLPTGSETPWVTPLGDFNGDGFDDLACRRSYADPLMILYGSAQPDTLADWQVQDPAGYHYNTWCGAGDINGDGYADFAGWAAAPRILDIFLGGADPDTTPSNLWVSQLHQPEWIVNDLTGDSSAELLAINGEGGHQLATYFGGPTLAIQPNSVLNFGELCDESIDAVRSLGDINGDGWNDMLAINSSCSMGWGRLALFLGSPTLSPYPAWTLSGRVLPLNLIGIWEAAGLGDVNGDGINDFILGCWNGDGDGMRGRAVVVSGDTAVHVGLESPIVAVPQELKLNVFPNPFNSAATVSLELPPLISEVQLMVYNVLGQRVFDTTLHPSSPSLRYALDASGFSSGVYLLHVTAGSLSQNQKLLLLK